MLGSNVYGLEVMMWEFVEDIIEVLGWLMLYALWGLGLSALVYLGFKGVM